MSDNEKKTFLVLFTNGQKQRITAHHFITHSERIDFHSQAGTDGNSRTGTILADKVSAVIEITTIEKNAENWANE